MVQDKLKKEEENSFPIFWFRFDISPFFQTPVEYEKEYFEEARRAEHNYRARAERAEQEGRAGELERRGRSRLNETGDSWRGPERNKEIKSREKRNEAAPFIFSR